MSGMRAWSWIAAPAALLAAGAVAAAPPPGTDLAFIACPIARDTGPDTDVCFLAEYQGASYALVNPADSGNPQLHHRVLVEGKVGEGASVCGATPFIGRASVLPELDAACDTVLPFDGSVVGVAGGIFNSGPPEQRAAMRALGERAVAQPALSIQPVMPDPPPPPAPTAPFAPKDLAILYPFDSDRGSGPDMLEVVKLVAYAAASNAQVTVTSRQGATKLSNGEVLAERPGMARRRAEKMAGILTGLGLPAKSLKVSWTDEAAAPTGADDFRQRRIDLHLQPGR